FDLLAARVHRVFDLHVARGSEDVDHFDARIERCLDIFIDHARQPAGRHTRALGDVAHGFELGIRIHWKPGLDDVGTHLGKYSRDLALVVVAERGAWRLLAVA